MLRLSRLFELKFRLLASSQNVVRNDIASYSENLYHFQHMYIKIKITNVFPNVGLTHLNN